MAACLAAVRHLARHQVMGLTAQFLPGVAVNLAGQPSQATGAARIASTVFLAAHALIALGMAIGAVLTVRASAASDAARRTGAPPRSPPPARSTSCD